MKYTYTFKIVWWCALVGLFFSGALFVSAYLALFVSDTQEINETLTSLESATTTIAVSIDHSFARYFNNGGGEAGYAMNMVEHCNIYDANYNCLDIAPNLCPYLAVQPTGDEPTEIGFTEGPLFYLLHKASGQLNYPTDETDTWNISVTSPCFEGECPNGYDVGRYGGPLPQSLKNHIFKCDVFIDTTEHPVLVQKYLKYNIAYADTQANSIEISATLTGSPLPPPPAGNSNVLFLPGLEASRLYMPRPDCSGPLCEDQLWEPNANADIEDLYLNADGTSVNPAVYTKDVIDESNTPVWTGALGQNIYKSFEDKMDGLVADHSIASWRAFAYDWRQGADTVAGTPQKYDADQMISLKGVLRNLADSSQNGKVTIVAHSNGGLVAKALLKKLADEKAAGADDLIDRIDALILVAVPQIGTPEAIPAMLHGYDQRIGLGLLMDQTHARELGRNMPGAYGLLPSRQYVNTVPVAPVTFSDSALAPGVVTPFVTAYGSTTDSYAELESFLKGAEGRVQPSPSQTTLPIALSSDLLSQAETLHDSLDAWTPPENVRVIQIAGWGIDTVAGWEYVPAFECVPNTSGAGCTSQYVLDERPIFTADGDRTVVVPSALSMEGEKWWVDIKKYNSFALVNRYHADILEINDVINFLVKQINNQSDQSTSLMSDIMPTDITNRLRLSVHSPVTFDAYDAEGRHTGKICSADSDFCFAEEGIPNSSYAEFGEGKYLNVPGDGVQAVRLAGTDVGTFTYESSLVSPDGQTTETSYMDIPVTPQTVAEVMIDDTTHSSELHVDVDGDGTNDFVLEPQTAFDPVLYLQILQKTVDTLDISQKKKDVFDRKIDRLITFIQKGKIQQVQKKIERLSANLERKIEKPEPKRQKSGRLSKTDAELLYNMLNQLLDNLN